VARYLAALQRGLWRHPLLLVNIALVLMVAAIGLSRGTGLATGNSSTPADLFMQSIATEDGDLGWAQLCPEMQNQLPREVLEQQTRAQRTLQQQQSLTLTVEHVGDRARPTGGEIRIYVATVHDADGASGQKTYVIKTQPSGCVEAVE
jgi:hypothetical protein